jgi:LmbE family N-acetylglucosaminyl deacetylase
MTLRTDPKTIAERKADLYDRAPIHPRGDLRAWRSTVIVAPHPDDEALGCGGLIRLLTEARQTVRVVFVSDGAMSHPDSRDYPYDQRVALREAEAREATGILGVPADRVIFFRLPDTQVPREWDERFASTTDRIVRQLVEWRVDTLVVPWRRDPHGDHRGSWELFRTAARRHDGKLRWIEYPVWMWEATNTVDLPRPDEMIAWKLDVVDQLDRKEEAIRAHRSQWAGVIADDPSGFQLTDGMIGHFLRPAELYFEDARKRDHSLTESYFDRVYRSSDDPWDFEHSAYERAKYEATLAALTKPRYRSGFEIGCSIGVLTEMLADRCDRLLAIDTSERPLRQARRRLADRSEVSFRQMEFPASLPEETFDLIVVSEVGYYWGYADLDRAIEVIGRLLAAGGTLVLVHYTPYVPDYPLTGDEVHEAFKDRLHACYHLRERRSDRYRLDVWRKRGSSGPSA